MHSINKLAILILFLTVNSCHPFKEKGIKLLINNNSDFVIEKVKCYTSEKLIALKFDKIEVNESVADFLSMKNNTQDGSYILEFTHSNGNKESKKYGYYTNGRAMDKSINFEIQNDTIITKFGKTLY